LNKQFFLKYISKKLLVLIALISFCFFECVPQKFPYIRPQTKPSRDLYAKRRAEEYFVKARDFERKGMLSKALQYYQLAFKLDPESKSLRNILINRYVFSSKYNEAILLIKGTKKEEELSDEDKSLCANIYIKMGKYLHAAELLESLKNKNKEELYSIALIYENFGKTEKALQYYKKCLEKDTTSVFLLLKVASLYVKEKKYNVAESLYVNAAKSNENNPLILNALAELNLAKGDTSQAIIFLKMATMIDTTFIDGLQNLAAINIRRGNYEDAVKYYERIYSNSKYNIYIQKMLGILYFFTNNLEKAKTFFLKFLSNDINDYESHFYLGRIYLTQDSLDLAEIEFGKTLAIKGDYFEAFSQLCYLDLKKKDYESALLKAKKFAKVAPNNAISWRTLGYVYNQKKEYTEAIAALKKSVSIDSLDSFTWFELGCAFERLKNISEAENSFKRALSINPHDGASANYLGYMWAEKGIKLDSAKKLIEIALAYDSISGAYLDSYAWVFFKMGQIDSAFFYIEKALKYLNTDGIIYSHYGDILLKKNMFKEALNAFKKSLEIDSQSEEVENVKEKIKYIEEIINNNKNAPFKKNEK
jgi:tetratricopeptide (TPR) repeat protein